MKSKSRNQARKHKHLKIRQKIAGTSTIPRLTVYKSHQNFYAQLIDDSKGITLTSATTLSKDSKYSGNVAAAEKLGHEMGKKIKALKIEQIVFDRSGYIYHGKVKSFAEAVRAEGVKF